MKTLSLMLALSLASAPLGFTAPDDVDRTQPPAAGPLPAVTFPDAVTETLPNGMNVFILPTQKQPMVTFRLLLRSGEICDGTKPGLADLTASLLNKGTAELSAGEFAKKTDFLGIRVEAQAGDDATAITASGLSRDSAEILGFLRDAALHPAFQQGEVDKEKRKMIADLTQKKMEPEDLSERLRDKLLYGQHPYGASPTPETVQTITREDIVQFHEEHFLPNNASLVIVGDVQPEAVLAQVKEAFGTWKQGTVAMNYPIFSTKKGSLFPLIKGISVAVVDRPGSVQSNILVAGRGVAKNNADLPQLGVVNAVLGGGMSGRLFANLREKHGYTYGSYSGFTAKKFGGTFAATAQVRNAVTGAAVGEILAELKRIHTEPVPEKELALQRNYLIGNFLMSVENDERTAQRQQEIDLYGLPADYYKTYAAKLAALTPEKAAELAKQYIDPAHLVIVVVGEAKEIVPQLEKYGKVTVYDADLQPVSGKAAKKGQ
ncbi:MAG: pitrilysin family protein [Chthoniobacteraceae bacterium]|nr:pitrilysin family protein [Chthoniobacteraceae bacterium]